MDINNIHPSHFTPNSYRVAYSIKGPDDIYVSQPSFFNFPDSNCIHFEQKSTHSEEKAHEYQQQQQKQRRRYLKWIDVEATAANKYRDYGEGLTYEDIVKRFLGLNKTNRQAQNILRNYKNKGKLYTCH